MTRDRKPSVLVVDDEPAIRSLCSHLLAEQGWQADQAPGADAALQRMADRPYDILLTDLCMEGALDGADLVRRAKVRHPKTSVILMTGFPTVESAVDALHHGASDYILKPFTAESLVESVRRVWETRRLAEELERVHALKAELEAAREELMQLRTALPEEARRLAALLKKSGCDSGTSADDLLSYAELEGGRIRCRMRDMDLGALLQDLVAKSRPLWKDRGLELTLAFDPRQSQAWADPELTRMALKQLLADAIEQGVPGAAIRLALSRGTDSSRVELEAPIRPGSNGLGLALAIARRALRLQGGSLDASSERGLLRRVVTLPRPSVFG